MKWDSYGVGSQHWRGPKVTTRSSMPEPASRPPGSEGRPHGRFAGGAGGAPVGEVTGARAPRAEAHLRAKRGRTSNICFLPYAIVGRYGFQTG